MPPVSIKVPADRVPAADDCEVVHVLDLRKSCGRMSLNLAPHEIAVAKSRYGNKRYRGALNAYIISRMGTKGVVSHELLRDLGGKFRIQPSSNIDVAKFRSFGCRIMLNCFLFNIEVRAFGIGLRADRDKLAGPH